MSQFQKLVLNQSNFSSRGFRTSSWKREGFCDPLPPQVEKFLKCRSDVKLETCIIDDSSINPCWDIPKVVIVGAGMAGLSAAARLGKCGITDVVVLEASDRPGGRIHSCWLGETIVEIGASYLLGTSITNSAFPLAAREGLVREPLLKETKEGIMMTSDSDMISIFISAAADACFKTILKQAADLFVTCGPGAKCGSLFDFISNRIDQEIKLFPFEYRNFAAKVMVSGMIDLESKIGAELHKVAACQFGTLVDIPGGNVKVPAGMVGILAPLLQDMPKCDNIIYCKPVSRIVYQPGDLSGHRVKVFCSDGDVFDADYVIITVSLGVLKNKAKEMFQPSLPDEKLKAINDMGFGYINHLYLEYEQPFWVWNEGSLRLAWNFDEMVERGHWTNSISAIKEVATSQQVLQITVGGESAKCIEDLTDIQLAEDMTRLYRKFLKNPTLPYPVNLMRSRWTTSPFFYGAQSYFALGTTLKSQSDLGKPIPDETGVHPPALLFAGEATAIGAHGSIHGARSSGLKEADRVISLTKKWKGRPKIVEQAVTAV